MDLADEREVNGVESIKEKPGTTGQLDHSKHFIHGKDTMTLDYR